MLRAVVFALVAVASANVVHDGKCPEIKPVENFNLTAYAGKWFEISKYPYEAEKNCKCSAAEYKQEGLIVKVKNTCVVDKVETFVEGTVKLADDANNAGKLVVTLQLPNAAKDAPLAVLATDYTNYAIAYRCKNNEKSGNHEEYAWVMSRTNKLEGDAKKAVDEFIKNNSKVLDAKKFQATDFSEAACKFDSTAAITEKPKQ